MKPSKPEARQKTVVDWAKVDSMLMAGCSGDASCRLLGISYKTLQRACKRDKGVQFDQYRIMKHADGNAALLGKQYQLAMTGRGDKTMLIWLGKNRLEQSDRQSIAPVRQADPVSEDLSKLTDTQLREYLRLRRIAEGAGD